MAKYSPGAISFPVLLSHPTENPDAGKLFFYVIGSTIHYKDSAGTIYTLATGVSPEEVQDIIGAAIVGGDGINFSYNDAANALEISINRAEVINDLGTGATDILSAQNIIQKIADAIAAHLGASDPHPQYTTATELASALTAKENTGVAASLIAAHEAAANPHPNYATDSDLTSGLATKENTGVAASLDASHVAAADPHPQYATDTALTSGLAGKENTINATTSADYYRGDKTFANFLNAVLAVVLTGYAVGTNAALVATDTILQAFGKIQGQINQINSILLAQILGDQFEEFSDLTAATTTGTTNVVAAAFTTLQKPVGKYRIGITWLWDNTTNTSDGIFDVYVDNVLIKTIRAERNETVNQRINECLFFYSNFATIQTHDIELRMRKEATGGTLSVYECRFEIWRVN